MKRIRDELLTSYAPPRTYEEGWLLRHYWQRCARRRGCIARVHSASLESNDTTGYFPPATTCNGPHTHGTNDDLLRIGHFLALLASAGNPSKVEATTYCGMCGSRFTRSGGVRYAFESLIALEMTKWRRLSILRPYACPRKFRSSRGGVRRHSMQ